MTEHKSTDWDIVLKKFLKKNQVPIKVDPTMAKITRVLPHFCNSAKSHCITGSPMGLLYIALPQVLYNLCMVHIYPNQGLHTGPIHIFQPNANDAEQEIQKLQ